MTHVIRLLAQDDARRNSFDCGKASLDNWFYRNAWRNQKSGTSRSYVIEDKENNRIKGYMTLSPGEIQRSYLPKSKQRNMPDPVPIILLAQLAVDLDYQGQGLSKSLLAAAFSYAVKAADIIGSFALLTHPLDEEVRSFYERWGFQNLEADPKGAMYVRIIDLVSSNFS